MDLKAGSGLVYIYQCQESLRGTKWGCGSGNGRLETPCVCKCMTRESSLSWIPGRPTSAPKGGPNVRNGDKVQEVACGIGMCTGKPPAGPPKQGNVLCGKWPLLTSMFPPGTFCLWSICSTISGQRSPSHLFFFLGTNNFLARHQHAQETC